MMNRKFSTKLIRAMIGDITYIEIKSNAAGRIEQIEKCLRIHMNGIFSTKQSQTMIGDLGY